MLHDQSIADLTYSQGQVPGLKLVAFGQLLKARTKPTPGIYVFGNQPFLCKNVPAAFGV